MVMLIKLLLNCNEKEVDIWIDTERLREKTDITFTVI